MRQLPYVFKQTQMESIENQQMVLNTQSTFKKTHAFRKFNAKINSVSRTKLFMVVIMITLLEVGAIMLLKPYIISAVIEPTLQNTPAQPIKLQTTSLSKQVTSESHKFQSRQIRNLNSDQTIDESKPLDLQPVYIWLGDEVPDHHQKKLNDLKFVYRFRLIRNCDMLLADMQKELKQKFNKMVYETVNMKSDLCRFIYLYYYGGLYLDLDTTVDLPCLNNYLKDKRIFFEETPQKTIDIFTIYSAKPYDPQWMKAIKAYNTYNSFFKYYTSYSASTLRISDGVKKIGRSGCVTHKQQRAWVPKI